MNPLWLKAFHIISVIIWMTGMLVLPWLFEHHSRAIRESETDRFLIALESSLLRYVMNPAMGLVWALGIWLVIDTPSYLHEPWFHAKAALILIISTLHHLLAVWRKRFVAGTNRYQPIFYRSIGLATLTSMVGIVILVVVRPF